MDFLGMGSGEILLILVIVLILWGPGKLVEISRTLGKTVHAFRKATSDLAGQVTRELDEQQKQVTPPKDDSPGRGARK
ncbi:MAG: twin-arginine translocase TatA/TatE family subunit [Dehalococcoidia bacterium]|nr:twin-arginine translocase TatA/TatE family subunit [Dehalococcoidia bacterium]